MVTRRTGDHLQFRSPSGRIGCAIGPTSARCDVLERRWTAPPPPSACDGDFGNGVEVDERGARVTCATDSVHDSAAPVLEYGSAWDVGDVRCVSARSGVHCVHRGTGHGFEVSRDRYQLF